ncbi:MAG: exodeoxyribonuclease VII large subunit [Pseudomonadota bacterium]
MTKQLDIFIEEGAHKDSAVKAHKTSATQSDRKKKKRPRAVKKAPLIVDSYDSEPHASPLLCKEGTGEVDQVPPVDLPKIFSVSEITELIKQNLETSFTDVWVSGEVTDFRGRKGPHSYFALKDESSQIRAIIFGAGNGRLKFELEDGLKLVCRGRLNVYAPKGTYSLIIDPEHCEPEGIGALKLAFEQLKKKLDAEGLFDASRKKPIPYLPKRIGIITAPDGAAIRDLIHVLTRRFPNIEVLIHPSRVQGDGAAQELAHAIEVMNEQEGLDVLIVGRGGGSMEDLWAFNEEVLARAIADSKIPIVSAVGHEIDFTISDFVADLRAATPSAAAELLVPVRAELMRTIADYRERLAGGLLRVLENQGLHLRRLEARLGDPRKRLPDLMQRVDSWRERLGNSIAIKTKHLEQHLAKLLSNLDHLSPLGVLAKGYAVAEGPDGRAITDSKSLKIGDPLKLRFRKGSASAKVTKIIDE